LLGALAVFFFMVLSLSIRAHLRARIKRLEEEVERLEEEVERLGGQAAR